MNRNDEICIVVLSDGDDWNDYETGVNGIFSKRIGEQKVETYA